MASGQRQVPIGSTISISNMGDSQKSLHQPLLPVTVNGDSPTLENSCYCCEDGAACKEHLSNANYFLPPGVMPLPLKAETGRSISSLKSIISTELLTDIPNTNEDDEHISRVGRSHFTATGICCSLEIPKVKSILLPIKGVEDVQVNSVTKAIFVIHDIDTVAASDLCRELGESGFNATIIKDAAVEITQKIGIPLDVKVVSVFDVKVQDGNAWEPTRANVISALAEDGKNVVRVSQSQRKNSITVVHNPYHVTATQIAHSLNKAGCVTTITSDGGTDGRWALEAMKYGVHNTIEMQETSVRWPVILSGVFGAVSFLR